MKRRDLRIFLEITIFLSLFWVLLICFPEKNFAEKVQVRDPWKQLQTVFPQTTESLQIFEKFPFEKISRPENSHNVQTTTDPWLRLQQVVVPFSLVDDTKLTCGNGSSLALKIKRKLKRWQSDIEYAARYFNIPSVIIEAVIMVESGGDPRAKSKSSSASGLMQIIKATFTQGRRALSKKGVVCADNPFNPHSSIMVGSWYLRKMFDQARSDGKPGVNEMNNLAAWHYPLQYYYSGPGNGRKEAPRLLIYSGGEQILIDKPAYSNKVIAWAENLTS